MPGLARVGPRRVRDAAISLRALRRIGEERVLGRRRREPPAPANAVYCETHSTPPPRKTSPSPALIAWKAIRIVWVDEAQKRLIGRGRQVVQAREHGDDAGHVVAPCRHSGSAQPQ
jgi:hypothetical protein